MTLLQVMMVAALLLCGMGVALLGSVKVALARRLQIDEARVGGLVSFFGFSMMPAFLLAGLLTDLLGPQVVLIGGSVFLAVSLFTLGGSGKYLWTLAGVLFLSIGWSLLVNVANVLLLEAFPGATKAYSTNLANVFFGLGAFLTPLFVTLLVRIVSFPQALAFLAALALVPGALTLGIDFPAPQAFSAEEFVAQTMQILGEPYLWILGLALIFYAPLEASMGAWTTTYLGDKGFKEGIASGLLSGFWLMFMAARLITAYTLPRGYETLFILALAVSSLLVMAGVALGQGKSMGAAMVLLAGLVFGPIFGTLMALLLEHFDPNVRGRAVGIFFAIGGIGWTVIPILIGSYARRTNVQKSFSIAMGAALGLCGIALVLLLF